MNGTEILVPIECEEEAISVLKFLADLSDREKRDFFVFIQGVKFAKGISDGDDSNEDSLGA